MTTGSANLDSLIDSIQEGQFYLFYGSNRLLLDGLVHGLLVNCVLPKQKHGMESMALYLNNVDYYQPDKSKVFSPERLIFSTILDKDQSSRVITSPRQIKKTLVTSLLFPFEMIITYRTLPTMPAPMFTYLQQNNIADYP
jgi:Rad51